MAFPLLASLLCLIYCISLSLWTQKVLLEPMKVEGIEMAHMDPTEIIVVPIPLSRIVRFVGFSTLALFVVAVPWWNLVSSLVGSIRNLTITTLVMLAISILCGAHPQHNLLYTLLASLYIACLFCLNPPVFDKQQESDNNLDLLVKRQATTRDEQVALVRSYTTLLVMIPFQVFNILDSGLQVQRWPLPMILGATTGWILGNVIGFVWVAFFHLPNSNVQAITEEDTGSGHTHPKNI